MPSKHNITRIFQDFTLAAIIFLHLGNVVRCSVTEDDNAVAILEIRLHIVFFREHRLRLVWQAQTVVV